MPLIAENAEPLQPSVNRVSDEFELPVTGDFMLLEFAWPRIIVSSELHAHLNGSLSNKTLQELHQLEIKGDVAWDQWEAIIDHGRIRTLQEGRGEYLLEVNIGTSGPGIEKSSSERCFQMFSVAHSLTSSPAALFKATREVIHEFSEDGVVYLELRSTPRQVPGTMTKTQYIQAIIDAILECRQSVNMLVKLLVSIDRRQGHKEAKDTLDLVVKVNQMYPDIVVGLDLSGDPSQGDFMEFLSVLAEARRYGLRLSIHCAEPKVSDSETSGASGGNGLNHYSDSVYQAVLREIEFLLCII
uniref:Adenosine deaminase domain-containing protein n=1 Tax=Timema genevievae TaxID=629358 RepID=A0A7R9K335_TIMGE|nr:unnamed protein product [Timema genevievae]